MNVDDQKRINGKEIASSIDRETLALKSTAKVLHIVVASSDHATQTYVSAKSKKAIELGVTVQVTELEPEVSLSEIKRVIAELNQDDNCGGIMVQLPLYSQLEPYRTDILDEISPDKDIDGLSSTSIGKTVLGQEAVAPATPKAIVRIINSILTDIKGKDILIINNSNLVGKPLAAMLSNRQATVTIANEFTIDLKSKANISDIVISATGQVEIFDHTYLKEDAILIDVTSKKIDGVTRGDFRVDDHLLRKVQRYTPVPGGVGPVTVSELIHTFVSINQK